MCVEFFERFDHLFTFGANIGSPASPFPTGAFTWLKTWQPVTVEDWTTGIKPRDRFTSVMTWQIESFTDVGGNKDQEFLKFIDLPSRTSQPFELAINGPQGCCANTVGIPSTPWASRARSSTTGRSFRSRKRSSASPNTHASQRARAGSAIEPSAISRQGGQPWSRTRMDRAPAAHGEGLLAFSNPEEALAGIDRLNADYERHARRATEIAHEHFGARRVLAKLVEEACA